MYNSIPIKFLYHSKILIKLQAKQASYKQTSKLHANTSTKLHEYA